MKNSVLHANIQKLSHTSDIFQIDGVVMTVVHNLTTSIPNRWSESDRFYFSRDGLIMTVDLMRGTTIVSVFGELDASNAHHLQEYAKHRILESRTVVVNLVGVKFFGAAGIAVLFEIDKLCRDADVRWVTMANRPTRRLLRICDPDATLMVVPTIQHALQEFAIPQSRRLLKLIT